MHSSIKHESNHGLPPIKCSPLFLPHYTQFKSNMTNAARYSTGGDGKGIDTKIVEKATTSALTPGMVNIKNRGETVPSSVNVSPGLDIPIFSKTNASESSRHCQY